MIDVCLDCDGSGDDSDGWTCRMCKGAGMVDERLMQMEWACAGSAYVRHEACGELAYKCGCEEGDFSGTEAR